MAININFIKRLNYRIYNWCVGGGHLLLRFILGRGINPLTSPGEGVTVFTSPYLSKGPLH